MHGVVFDTRSFSVNDGPGLRYTVFFKGCQLRCTWCHNPESQHPLPEPANRILKAGKLRKIKKSTIGYTTTVESLMSEIRPHVPFFEESGGGVTISGGEPLLQPLFAAALLHECKQEGIHTAVDTSGYGDESALRAIFPVTDLFLFDLKIMDEHQHAIHTGRSNRPILTNLDIISSEGKPVIIRIPLVEGITDTTDNLHMLMDKIVSIKAIHQIDLLPYHPSACEKYRRLGKTLGIHTSSLYNATKAQEIKEFFSETGLPVTIGG